MGKLRIHVDYDHNVFQYSTRYNIFNIQGCDKASKAVSINIDDLKQMKLVSFFFLHSPYIIIHERLIGNLNSKRLKINLYF